MPDAISEADRGGEGKGQACVFSTLPYFSSSATMEGACVGPGSAPVLHNTDPPVSELMQAGKRLVSEAGW